MGICRRDLPLACLAARVFLIDTVKAATSLDDLVSGLPYLEGRNHFHRRVLYLKKCP